MALPRPQPGDPIEARHIAAIYAALDRLRLSVAPPLGMTSGAGGTTLSVGPVAPAVVWIRLDSGGAGGKYAWTEQIPDADGEWTDGDPGTVADDPAFEVNGNTRVAIPSLARAWRSTAGTLIFQSDACTASTSPAAGGSTGSGGGPGGLGGLGTGGTSGTSGTSGDPGTGAALGAGGSAGDGSSSGGGLGPSSHV